MQSTIKMYSRFFIFKRRESTDEEIVILSENSPLNLYQLVREIHEERFDHCLPNDWIYETIREAFVELERGDFPDDGKSLQERIELCEVIIEPDPYYSQLYKWFGNSYASDFCAEWQDSFTGAVASVYELIGYGQQIAKERIYFAVAEFLDEQKEETTNDQ